MISGNEPILQVGADFVKESGDSGVYARGVEYFKAGWVLSVEVDQSGFEMFGLVSNGQGEFYHTALVIENDMTMGIGCECPHYGICKHVVAMALEAQARYVDSVKNHWPKRGKSISWKGLESQSKPVPNSYDSLGLIFEVVDTNVIRSRADRFSPAKLIPGAQMDLNCRIGTKHEGGKWRISEINWENLTNNFRYSKSKYALTLNPQTVEILAQIKSIYLNNIGHNWMNSNEWMHVNKCDSLRLFKLFEEFKESGGEFIYNIASKPIVELSDRPIIPSVRFDKDGKKGMKYSVSLSYDDHTISATNFVIESTKGRWGFIFEGNLGENKTLKNFRLAKIEPNLDAKYHPVVYGGYDVQVPKAELDEFYKSQYFELNRALNVVLDGVEAFTPPVLKGPVLIVKVTSSGFDSIFVEFNWQYGVDSDKFAFPVSNITEGINLRNLDREALIKVQVDELLASLTVFENGITTDMAILSKMDAFNFMSEYIEKLAAVNDVEVLIDGKLPSFNYHFSEPEILVNAESSDETDWLDINISLQVDGLKVNYCDLIVALLNDEEFVFLESGDIIELNHPKIQQLKLLVIEAQKLKDRPAADIAINRYNISFFEELNELGIIDSQAKEWLDLSKKLYNLNEIETYDIGPKFEGNLRGYQEIGYNWLMFLVSNSLGGILADDMGLGKTVQVIAMLSARVNSVDSKRPSLVIAPTSVVPNWLSEFEKFAPDINVTMLRSTVARSKLDLASELTNMDVLVTSYAIIQRDVEIFSKIDWDVVVIDEAQYLKNFQAKTYGAVRKLLANSKIALTGTPMENNLMELWSILSIVAPGLFAVREQFKDGYQRPIETGDKPEQLQRLKRRIRPFMLRRLKEDVLQELPPRIEQVVNLDLDPSHQKVYDLYLSRERQKIMGLLDDFKKNRFTILRSLVILRMLSLSAILVDSEKYSDIQSVKIEALMEFVEELLSENHKAIIFSQFTSFLTLIKNAFNNKNIAFSYLDGKTRNRAEVINQFKNGETSVFIISLKAGGVGLNLVEADYCFLMDPWWNPAVEQQAIDRMHRIGQSKPVNVYRFVSNGTIEEKVMQLKERKSKLFHSVMDEDATFSKAISAEDIKGLFDESK